MREKEDWGDFNDKMFNLFLQYFTPDMETELQPIEDWNKTYSNQYSINIMVIKSK